MSTRRGWGGSVEQTPNDHLSHGYRSLDAEHPLGQGSYFIGSFLLFIHRHTQFAP